MQIKVNIFYPALQRVVETEGPLVLSGCTIGECLQDLMRQYLAARDLLFDDRGRLVRQVFVFVNEENLSQPRMETPVKDGDTLIIASLITGG